MSLSHQQQQQQQQQYMQQPGPSSIGGGLIRSTSQSTDQQPQQPPGSAQKIDTNSPLFMLLLNTKGDPEYNQNLGEEILERLFDFSVDCCFFAKKQPDGKYVLPPEYDWTQLSQKYNPQPFSQPGPSSFQSAWQSPHYAQAGPSMQHRPQMAGPSSNPPHTPLTPLPAHPPEFYRFNQQAAIRPGIPLPPTPQQQLKSPFYPNPPSIMTPEQQQMYMQQQKQQQQQPGSVRNAMMSPGYPQQIPTPQSQQSHGSFSRQSSFKMNTPQPMVKQEIPNPASNKPMQQPQQQQFLPHPHQQQQPQEPYFHMRPPQSLQRIDANDNEMKPPNIAAKPNGMGGYDELISPKYQMVKNEIMSPLGRPISTGNVHQSPLQANGQHTMSQPTNVSPQVALTPPNGEDSPSCSSLAAALASKPGKSLLSQAMDDPQRSTASPASEASTASTSSRKRPAEEEGAQKAIAKRPRCNKDNMPYRNMLDFIMRFIPPVEKCIMRYIYGLLMEPVKSSKRTLEWDLQKCRTFTVSKPRVFTDKWKEENNIEKNGREITASKMEAEIENKFGKMRIGGYPLITKISSKEYVFLRDFQESPGLRENKTCLDFHQQRIVEYAVTNAPTSQPMPPSQPNQPYQMTAQHFTPGAPIKIA